MARSTLEQLRAQNACEVVKRLKGPRESDARSILEQLPGMIAVNGLLPALLYLRKENKRIFDALQQWLYGSNTRIGWSSPREGGQPGGGRQERRPEEKNLDDRLAGEVAEVYRRATYESVLYAGWLKRWAQALLKKRTEAQASAEPPPGDATSAASSQEQSNA